MGAAAHPPEGKELEGEVIPGVRSLGEEEVKTRVGAKFARKKPSLQTSSPRVPPPA